MDSEYDTGSMHSDLSMLEGASPINEAVLASASISRVTPPFISRVTPPNPAMHVLSSQRRETHNRSPVSFREGRRASDTSLTQGRHSYFHSSFLCTPKYQVCWTFIKANTASLLQRGQKVYEISLLILLSFLQQTYLLTYLRQKSINIF